MTAVIDGISVEYARVPIYTVGGLDPTSDAVALAFMPDEDAKPGDDDWQDGSWDTYPGRGPYIARTLIGESGTVLAAGTYYAWVKVTDDPETPAKPCGKLIIT